MLRLEHFFLELERNMFTGRRGSLMTTGRMTLWGLETLVGRF